MILIDILIKNNCNNNCNNMYYKNIYNNPNITFNINCYNCLIIFNYINMLILIIISSEYRLVFTL